MAFGITRIGSSKKSQVTIFVVLGVVLLLVVGLIFLGKEILNREKPPVVTTQNVEVLAVQQFVESCLFSVGKEGIITLGRQGGYINPEIASLYIVPGMPSAANSVELAPESGVLVAYWYYLESSDTCTSECEFASKRPPLYSNRGSTSVESQLKNYIDSNIGSCINNLDSFRDKFDIIILGDVESKVIVGERSILVSAYYPVDLHREDLDAKLRNEYHTELDVNFKRIYEMASDILLTEMNNEYRFLERITRTLISSYSSLEDSKMPPLSGRVKLESSIGKTWLRSEAAEELQHLLAEHIPLIQIVGSRQSVSMFNPDDMLFTFVYKNLEVPLAETPKESLDTIRVDFTYLPWWPVYLKVHPSAGELIMPKQFINLLIIPIIINDYDFNYDVSYPVIATLKDNEAFNGQGYTLNFAMEANMRSNRPLTSDMEILEIESVPFSLFTDPSQRNSGIITIKAIDQAGMPLPRLSTKYSCGDEAVFAGETALDEEGEAVLETKLPLCVNGYVSGMLNGYFVKSTPLTIDKPGQSKTVVVQAEKIMKKELSILVKIVDKQCVLGTCTWKFLPESAVNIEPDEDVMLIFTRKTLPGEEEFVKFIQLNGVTERDATIELVSGDYQVEGYLMRNLGKGRSIEKIFIPSRDIEVDKDPLNPFAGKETYTIPAVEFNTTLYRGGIKLAEGHGSSFNITVSQLAGNDEVVVYLVGADITDFERIEDLEYMGKAEEYSKQYWRELMPVFKRHAVVG